MSQAGAGYSAFAPNCSPVRQSLSQSIIDHNFLEAVRLWLEPLSDKSLPALNIQRLLFEQLGKVSMKFMFVHIAVKTLSSIFADVH